MHMNRMDIGVEDFAVLRENGNYYVDKTELLYDLFGNSRNVVTLFTRPRRFGKTLTMSMMESFFTLFRPENEKLFRGLRIREHREFCDAYMNRYPVVSVSLKGVEGLTFDAAYRMLGTAMADICKKYAFLLESDAVDEGDREVFRKLRMKEAEDDDIKNALKTVMRMMHAVYGKTVILLIDEYDVPLAKAWENGYYREMLDMIRGIMNSALKTNEFLKFAVVTGCLRIPKESIFTGVNNFVSYSVLDTRYSGYFGFTEEEIRKMLAAYGFSEKEEIIREWYDGYIFGSTSVYCPWDVINYVNDLLYSRDSLPQNYWENTSGNGAISAFFDLDLDVSDKFETLMNGGTITEKVSNALTYDKAYASEEGLWSILLMTGYVTISEKGSGCDRGEGERVASLRIPNREIENIFESAVKDHFLRTLDRTKVRELMAAFWSGEEEKISEILSDMLWRTISYHDYGEDYYHAFLAGIFVGRGGYAVKSNLERGLGRLDIQVLDKKNRRAIIIEAKISKSRESLEYCCGKALDQIRDREYAKNLDGYTTVLCYGIAFYRKTALARKLQ